MYVISTICLEASSDEIEQHLATTTRKSKKRFIGDSSLKQVSKFSSKETMSNIKSPSIIPPSSIQNQVIVNHFDIDQCSITKNSISCIFENIFSLDSTEQNTDETNVNTIDKGGFFSLKAFKKLQKENITLRKEKASLENVVNFMKKNYIRK